MQIGNRAASASFDDVGLRAILHDAGFGRSNFAVEPVKLAAKRRL
ncbi:hypothetical protein [Sphingomonas qomolangmaensis]|uniref:Uncharacterized protein n=1 Tax=Sphingomonas qomolangmaensis TaxID=2918765 RepID=A0ABY5L6V4_9SPHN|nr:hypothetical protein [Sphingomonas qomolangmaensis]UUL81617.1 hypothetical protein NMP03_10430 [Sphingomonas qomolangmaensis]